MTGELGDSLDARRAALRARLLAESGVGTVGPEPVPLQAKDAPVYLTDAQERLWFLHQLTDDTSSLNVRSAIRIRGPFKPSLLARCLAQIVERHEVLRWAVASVGGVPTPTPLSEPEITIVVDADPSDEAAIESILIEEAGRRFDIGSEVPVALRVIRLGPEDHVVSVVMHHIVSDDWSRRVFETELLTFYAVAAGSPAGAALPELTIQYRDFAAWQRERVKGPLAKEIGFWRDTLKGAAATSDLPTDYPRPSHHSVDGASIRREISGDFAARVRAVSAHEKATPFMTLLTAYGLALSRASGQYDLLVGTPVAGRSRPETTNMLGVFLNTLVLRLRVDPAATFRTALGSVRDVCLDAFGNQEVPFERLLSEFRPARDQSRTPYFSTMFNMTTSDVGTPETSLGLDLEWLPMPEASAKFDLTVYAHDSRDRIDFLFVYNKSLYDPDTIKRFADLFVGILDAGLAAADQPIREALQAISAETAGLPDASAVLDDTWSGTVFDAVQRSASSTPDQPAIADPEAEWSYAELFEGAKLVAARLQHTGLRVEEHVAIIGARRASLGVAVLGALHAGTPYAIIDPDQPAERIAQQLRIMAPRVVVDITAGDEIAPDVTAAIAAQEVEHILIGPQSADLPTDWATLPFDQPAIGPDTPALLTFTSGSTGMPKAVVGAHGSLTHFFPWMSTEWDVGPSDRFSLLSGLPHDPIQRDLFWAFWVGATVVVPDGERIGEPAYVAQWLADEQITVAHLTPAMGRLIVDTARVATLASLRRAFFIGDRLTGTVVREIDRLAPTATIISLYGTTETQRASGWYSLTHTDRADPSAVWVAPLGVAMPGCQMLVESAPGYACGIGETGEIVMRSPHLALGYLNDAGAVDATERFTPSGSADGGQERSYRTGDLGRRRADGTVEFRGRIDDQVKIRGFRVEPADITTSLERCDEISQCVTVVYDRDAPSIGVYVIAANGHALEPSGVLALARTRLPSAMVPSRAMVVDQIPLSANGKVDASIIRAAAVPVGGESPTDELERTILQLWQEVLETPIIGIHDNFFDLGGYSLLATRLFSLIDDRVGVSLPASILFEAPTVAELATAVRQRESRSQTTPFVSLVPIQPRGQSQPLFYVMPYTISVLQLSTLADVLGRTQPLYGVQPQGLEEGQAIHESVEEMATHYIAELRVVQPEGPYVIGGHCAGSIVAFEICQQLEAAGHEVSNLLLVDQGPPGVERPNPSILRYVVGRLRFFAADRRLFHAILWQLRLLRGRWLLRRMGTSRQRRREEVIQGHREAHARYTGGSVKAPVLLLRSDETILLGDREWHLGWRQKTSGSFNTDTVRATHAMLLERPYVEELAEKVTNFLEVPGGVPEPSREPS